MKKEIRAYFKKYAWARNIYYYFNKKTLKNIKLEQKFHGEIKSFIGKRTNYNKFRINLVIHSISKRDRFGGIATSLKIFDKLCVHFDEIRIIVTDVIPYDDDLDDFIGWKIDRNGDSISNKAIVSCDFRSGKPISIGDNDIFLSTSWWGSLTCIDIINWQNSTYGNYKNRKFIYLIQDFECGFYPWSSHYILAEQSYRYPNKTIAIFNSEFLSIFMKKNGYEFYNQYTYFPKLNKNLKEFLKINNIININKARKKKIIIYGREDVQRNCFTLILESLRLISEIRNCNEWEFVSLGIQHAQIVHENLNVNSKGKVSLQEYAIHMSEAFAGISLMASPHPSYPPLEMAAYGIRVVTNNFESKNMSVLAKNIKSLDFCTPENIKHEIIKIMDSYEQSPLGLFDNDFINSYVDGVSEDENISGICEALMRENRLLE